jgi:two-component system heavy metal sensor histidine kinase CusS
MRLTAWYTLASFAIILVTVTLLYLVLVSGLDNVVDRFLADKVGVLRGLVYDPARAKALQSEVAPEQAARQYAQVYVRILDDEGRLIMETPGMSEVLPAWLFPAPVPSQHPPEPAVGLTSRHHEPFRAIAAKAARPPRDRPDKSGKAKEPRERVIQVAIDNTPQQELITVYRARYWAILAAALVLSALAGHRIAQRSLRPVRQIAQTVQGISSTRLSDRVQATQLPAELSTLGEAFNATMDRLQDAFERLGQFSADLAHELRTPLTNLRGGAEVALSKARSADEYRQALESNLEEAVRISRIIDSLLFLARAEDPRTQIHCETLDLAAELSAVREFYEAAAAEARVKLAVECPPGLSGRMDRVLLQRAVGNLVGNALRYTPSGGRIQIAAQQADGQLQVQVSDTGSGIAPEHLPHVFDRFYRADRSRAAGGGVGLGLAIVKSIASLHGGTVQIASHLGKGTTVTLRVPASEDQGAAERRS